MSFINNGIGWIMTKLSHDMPVETDFSEPMEGSWYLSPAQHGFELIGFSVFYYLVFLSSIKRVCRQGSPEWKLLALYDNTTKMTLLEQILSNSALASWSLILCYKALRNDLISLLQPCHMNLLVLLFILNFPKKYTLPHFVYNIFLHGIWGTLLAISAPDLRGYDMLFEVENFWFEHYLLLAAPFLLMLTGRYVVWPPSFTVGVLSHSLNALYNIPFLSTVSLLTGLNVNYTLSPPPGILESFGSYYRIMSVTIIGVLSLFIRFTITEFGKTSVLYLKDKFYSTFSNSKKSARLNQ